MKKLLSLVLVLLFITGCSPAGIKAKRILNAELPTAELVNLPLADNTISFTFSSWVDETQALVCRNAQDSTTLDTFCDYFLYDTAKHRYYQIPLPSTGRYVFESLVPKNRILFVTTKEFLEENGAYAGYRIASAYLYDISNGTGKEFKLSVESVSSEQTPEGTELIFPYDHSPHVFFMTENSLTIRYFGIDTDGYTVSPDGTQYAYTDVNGLFVCDSNFSNSQLILPDFKGQDPNGMDSEAPRNPRWIGDNRIAYSWVGYEWLIGTGIINSDGSSDNRPAVLKGRYITQTPTQNLFIVNSFSDSEPFLGVYNLSNNTMTDITSELNLNYIQNVLISPDCRTLLVIGAGADDFNTLNILIELKGDYSRVQKIKRLNGSYEFFNNGVISVFSPDNKRILFQASYEGKDYMLYSVEIKALFSE